MMLRGVSPTASLTKIEVPSARSRESFGTSCSSVAAGACHTGGPLLVRIGAAGDDLGGTKVEDLRHQYLGHAFLLQVPSLTLATQVVCHLHLHLHLHPCLVHGLVHELDMMVFALTWQRLHVSLGDQVAHATRSLADTQDSSSPTQYVPLWSAQLERNTDQKLNM